ncbi:MAG: hybrid sensor histidine kinase/response regulator transcription factor [Bacteroidales bacterium]
MVRILLYSLFLAITTILLGCTDTRVYKIGVSQCSQDDWRTKMNEEIYREIMFHEDASVEILSALDNNEKQIEDIKYFVENDFDIIIVSPNEAAALTPIIEQVYKSGMPVIIFDRNIICDTYTVRMGVNNEGLGRSAAQYALHLLGKGAKAIEIYGLRGSTPAEERHNGFAIEFAKGGGELLTSVEANWNKENAVMITDSLLNIYPEIDLIYAHNDRMAIGASEVASKKGRNDIKIIGIDAAPNIGIKAVVDSVIDATFLYPTEGHRLIQTALAILKNEPYERDVQLPVSSAVDLTNADILLLQNETLNEETRKIILLKSQIDDFWAQHSAQTSLFYSSIAIIMLLFGVAFLLLRAYWQHSRHQKTLMYQNNLLERERDKQESLNKQLQKATHSKLMFFTDVSHDLLTPLTLISEPVAQIAEADNLTDQQRTLMKIADKNVKILTRLINQILDFRKYESGRLNLKLTEIDFNIAINDWMDSFYALARKRDIKLLLHPPKENSILIAIDVEKIERVFFNLISNSFKYTPNNGTISVYYESDGSNLILKVADTGEGISESDLENIFDRFYQANSFHPNGSGIGLSLTKAFVDLHGGSISADSILGKGSTFTVNIPIKHIATEASNYQKMIVCKDVQIELDTVDSDVVFGSDKPLILVIDDNKDIQKLVSELLGIDYNIITAINGKDGIRMAVKYVPDLIICDVMMPIMDGLECCKRIKAEISTSHIPVLMLTACSMDEDRVKGYDSGADGYLAKPFNSSVLKSRCSSLIENRKRIKSIWQSTLSSGKEQSQDKQLPTSDIDNDFYNLFLSIFNESMGDAQLNIDTIASRMGLERSQLYRKIKSLTNFSPVELIRHLRLKHARELLLSTDRTISEIAYETGFSTPAYFTKCYRDAFGETPTNTRSKLTN